MSLRPRTVLTIEGWCYLVGAVFFIGGAVVRSINLLVALSAMMLATVIINWRWVAATMRRFDVRRQLPQTINAGDPLTIEIEVANQHSRRPAWVLSIADRIERIGGEKDTPVRHPRVLVNHIPARDTRRTTYRAVLTRRGRYRLGPLEVSTRFPFGLVRSIVDVERIGQLLVFPRTGRLTERWTALERDGDTARRAQLQKQQPLEGDFHSLRDWRAGDARRTIHWRTSARRGQLMVRQFEQQRKHDLVLIVDLWQSESPTAEQQDAIELAVSFAATVIAEVCRHGSGRLTAGIGGREPVWRQGYPSSRLLAEMLEQLAIAEATPAQRLPDLLKVAGDEITYRDQIVLVSTHDVNLSEAARAAGLTDERGRSAWLGRTLVLNAGSDQLFEYFRPDEITAASPQAAIRVQ
jgi:uncharacterized protein (DUF58 family)